MHLLMPGDIFAFVTRGVVVVLLALRGQGCCETLYKWTGQSHATKNRLARSVSSATSEKLWSHQGMYRGIAHLKELFPLETLTKLGPCLVFWAKQWTCCCCSVAKSCLTLATLWLPHARLPCPSPPPRVCSNSCPWVSDAIQPSHPLSAPSP